MKGITILRRSLSCVPITISRGHPAAYRAIPGLTRGCSRSPDEQASGLQPLDEGGDVVLDTLDIGAGGVGDGPDDVGFRP